MQSSCLSLRCLNANRVHEHVRLEKTAECHMSRATWQECCLAEVCVCPGGVLAPRRRSKCLQASLSNRVVCSHYQLGLHRKVTDLAGESPVRPGEAQRHTRDRKVPSIIVSPSWQFLVWSLLRSGNWIQTSMCIRMVAAAWANKQVHTACRQYHHQNYNEATGELRTDFAPLLENHRNNI